MHSHLHNAIRQNKSIRSTRLQMRKLLQTVHLPGCEPTARLCPPVSHLYKDMSRWQPVCHCYKSLFPLIIIINNPRHMGIPFLPLVQWHEEPEMERKQPQISVYGSIIVPLVESLFSPVAGSLNRQSQVHGEGKQNY